MSLAKESGPVLIREGNSEEPEYTLKIGDKEIGYISGRVQDEKWFNLTWFIVGKEYRNQKFGRLLMQTIVNELQTKNKQQPNDPIKYIEVYPSSENLSADDIYRVYEKLGFHFVSENPNRTRCGEYMRLELL